MAHELTLFADILTITGALIPPKKGSQINRLPFLAELGVPLFFFLTVSGSRTARHTVQHLLAGRACLHLPDDIPNSQKSIRPRLFATAGQSMSLQKRSRYFASRLRYHQIFKPPPALKKNSPARVPGHTVFAIQYAKIGGPTPGKVSPGGPPRDRPLRKASPGGTGRANPKQIFRQASKPLMAIVTPYCNKLRL